MPSQKATLTSRRIDAVSKAAWDIAVAPMLRLIPLHAAPAYRSVAAYSKLPNLKGK